MIAMFYVYALYSKDFDKIYIGFTSDLNARLNAHNHESNTGWTSKFKPWILFYNEEFMNKSDAMKREKQLKSSRGRVFIRSLLS